MFVRLGNGRPERTGLSSCFVGRIFDEGHRHYPSYMLRRNVWPQSLERRVAHPCAVRWRVLDFRNQAGFTHVRRHLSQVIAQHKHDGKRTSLAT